MYIYVKAIFVLPNFALINKISVSIIICQLNTKSSYCPQLTLQIEVSSIKLNANNVLNSFSTKTESISDHLLAVLMS